MRTADELSAISTKLAQCVYIWTQVGGGQETLESVGADEIKTCEDTAKTEFKAKLDKEAELMAVHKTYEKCMYWEEEGAMGFTWIILFGPEATACLTTAKASFAKLIPAASPAPAPVAAATPTADQIACAAKCNKDFPMTVDAKTDNTVASTECNADCLKKAVPFGDASSAMGTSIMAGAIAVAAYMV